MISNNNSDVIKKYMSLNVLICDGLATEKFSPGIIELINPIGSGKEFYAEKVKVNPFLREIEGVLFTDSHIKALKNKDGRWKILFS